MRERERELGIDFGPTRPCVKNDERRGDEVNGGGVGREDAGRREDWVVRTSERERECERHFGHIDKKRKGAKGGEVDMAGRGRGRRGRKKT